MLLLYHLYLYSYDQLRFILSNLLLPHHLPFQPSDLLRAGIVHRNVVPVLHCAASISFLHDALPRAFIFASHTFRLCHSHVASVLFSCATLLRCHASHFEFLYHVSRRPYRTSPNRSLRFTLSFLFLHRGLSDVFSAVPIPRYLGHCSIIFYSWNIQS
jgi:hypothetical protein